MAAVYAALLSLARSLHDILDLEMYIDPLHKEKIVSLHEKVDSIITFLEDYSEKYRETADLVENGIRGAAYEAQDFMDSYLGSVSRIDQDLSSCDKVSLDQHLNMAFERINFISDWEVEALAAKMKNIGTKEDLRSRTYSSPTDHSSVAKITAKSMVVGLDDDLNAIKERLYEDSAHLQIIPIVGMGGIGKTTLARKAYEDSRLGQDFDVCIWITVSMEYRRREILSNLLQYFKKPTIDHKEQSDDSALSEAELATQLYKNLMGRRYLIVIDDIWDTKAWDDLKMVLPNNDNKSRILLTTRLSDVALYAGSPRTLLHQMNFLNEDQSWKLLQERLFGQESCPLELVEIGKKIARNCGGLPLTIVVVAGLLLSSKNMMKKELWENVSENISSTEPTIALQCSKILCLSYDWLPLRLKPCFLYIAAFPEDSEIDVSKLIKLWTAEGFLKPSDQSKCLEDVGEGYLDDLVNRSLILVGAKGPDGKLQTIGIHDLLREICMTKGQEEGFFHHFSSETNAQKDFGQKQNRRVSIHCNDTIHDWRISDSNLRSVLLFSERYLRSGLPKWHLNILDNHKWQISDSNIRSVLHFNEGYLGSRLPISCRNLSILHAPTVTWPNLSDVISTFVNFRYIAFSLNKTSCPHGFPTSISKLPNLETIIAHITGILRRNVLHVPDEIWKMPKLRHLIINTSFRLSDPHNIEIFYKSDIQTLDAVLDFKFNEEAIKMLANLKKLKVRFNIYHENQWDDFNLNNIFHLQNLEELDVIMYCPYGVPRKWNYNFPISVKKLTLDGVPFPWENMTIIGSLPNLQVLEMLNIEVAGSSEWTPIEGQFLRLKYFRSSLDKLVKWEVEKEHFPSLETLVVWNPQGIDEIPPSIGEIDTLQLIELHNCRESSLVNSAKQIEEQQHENGNYAFQVRVIEKREYYNFRF